MVKFRSNLKSDRRQLNLNDVAAQVDEGETPDLLERDEVLSRLAAERPARGLDEVAFLCGTIGPSNFPGTLTDEML